MRQIHRHEVTSRVSWLCRARVLGSENNRVTEICHVIIIGERCGGVWIFDGDFGIPVLKQKLVNLVCDQTQDNHCVVVSIKTILSSEWEFLLNFSESLHQVKACVEHEHSLLTCQAELHLHGECPWCRVCHFSRKWWGQPIHENLVSHLHISLCQFNFCFQ